MEILKMFAFVCLAFQLPESWQEVARESRTWPGLVPGTSIQEEFAAWKGSEAELYAFYWKPSAPRPGGPLEAAMEWKRKIAGQEATVIETRQFMGSQQKVLVTHLKAPGAQIMIYARNMPINQFNAILDSLSTVDR